MEVQFTSEQEIRLEQMASMEWVESARLVQSAALMLIVVRRGIEQADQGMFIEEAEIDARIARMLNT
jgi:hypothetical protein